MNAALPTILELINAGDPTAAERLERAIAARDRGTTVRAASGGAHRFVAQSVFKPDKARAFAAVLEREARA